jgi:hypothetical protein
MRTLVLLLCLVMTTPALSAERKPSRSTQSRHAVFYGDSEVDAMLRAQQWMNRNGGDWRVTRSRKFGNSGRGYEFRFERRSNPRQGRNLR